MRHHSDAILSVPSNKAYFYLPYLVLIEDRVVEFTFCSAHCFICWGTTFKCQDIE